MVGKVVINQRSRYILLWEEVSGVIQNAIDVGGENRVISELIQEFSDLVVPIHALSDRYLLQLLQNNIHCLSPECLCPVVVEQLLAHLLDDLAEVLLLSDVGFMPSVELGGSIEGRESVIDECNGVIGD